MDRSQSSTYVEGEARLASRHGLHPTFTPSCHAACTILDILTLTLTFPVTGLQIGNGNPSKPEAFPFNLTISISSLSKPSQARTRGFGGGQSGAQLMRFHTVNPHIQHLTTRAIGIYTFADITAPHRMCQTTYRACLPHPLLQSHPQ